MWKKLICLIIAAAIATFMVGCSQDEAEDPVPNTNRNTSVDTSSQPCIKFMIKASDYDASSKTSTPAIVHVYGMSDSGKKVDFWHAATPNVMSSVDVAAGSYTMETFGPLNPDGSMYKSTAAQSLTFSSGNVAKAQVTLTKVAANDIVVSQVDELLIALQQSTITADETMYGSAGLTILNAYYENFSKVPCGVDYVIENALQLAASGLNDNPVATNVDATSTSTTK